MIKRDISTELIQASAEYPVVTIFGPRQSGKTTLIQMTFPSKPYFSMEDPDIRLAAETDPRGFLSQMPSGGIIDEIQRTPQLLSYIQGIVDENQQPGFFILSGSHQPELHQAISQSLAGRTAILTLYPFSMNEINHYQEKWDPFELMVIGFYPRIHDRGLKPIRFFNGYFQTYVERDVRSLINIKDLNQFQKFMRLLAGRIGQLINYTSLSNDIGVSSTTIKNWISVLKASYVIYELPPYYENIRKRLVKSSKIYFTDIGLATYLLDIRSASQLMRDPLRGGLYENLIILEFVKSETNKGIQPHFYFYRDSHGNEVDLLISKGKKLTLIEIKSSETFNIDFLKGVLHFKKIMPNRFSKGLVIYNGKHSLDVKGIEIKNPFIDQGFWSKVE
ncbi:ATP-binding protein [Candidatus Marinimicrobia bacterium]|nr:ATP-binding protein [Candidatus Neomarinimicrobiota bacterium]MDC1038646.1 ATP-binding protein [Candidatus Neomarinimicrobiota bacterium]